MRFPAEWVKWGMLPDQYLQLVVSRYEPGHEYGSEHDRNGAFHWWLKQSPSEEQLLKLAQLTWLDPDPLMGADVRTYIAQAENCSLAVAAWLQSERGSAQQSIQTDAALPRRLT